MKLIGFLFAQHVFLTVLGILELLHIWSNADMILVQVLYRIWEEICFFLWFFVSPDIFSVVYYS